MVLRSIYVGLGLYYCVHGEGYATSWLSCFTVCHTYDSSCHKTMFITNQEQ